LRRFFQDNPPWRITALVLVAYLGLVLTVTFPIAFRIFGGPIGRPEVDLFCHLWDIWWGWWTFFKGQGSYFFTEYLHYPDGIPTSGFLSGPLLFFMAGLLRQLTGDLGASFNIIVIFSFVCTAMGGYYAGLRLLKSRPAAFFVGVAVAFNPMVIFQLRLGLLEFINLGWGMMFLGSLASLQERMDLKSLLISIAWFMVTSLWAWYMGPLFLIFAGWQLLFLTDPRGLFTSRRRHALLLLGWVAATVGFVLFSFSVTSASKLGRTMQREEIKLVQQMVKNNVHMLKQVTSMGIHTPATMTTLEVKLNNSLDPFHAVKSWQRYVPGSAFFLPRWIVPLLLSFLALVIAWNRIFLMCGFVILFGSLVAVGPCVVIDGLVSFKTYGWTPFGLLARLFPEMGRMQFPNRMLLLAAIAIAIMAGSGLKALLERLRWSPVRSALLAVVASLLTTVSGLSLIDYPLPQTNLVVPSFYKRLSTQAGKTAVLDIPFLHGRAVVRRECLARNAFYQTTHYKLSFSGPVPAVLQGAVRPRAITDNEFIRRVAALTDGELLPPPSEAERARLRQALTRLRAYRFNTIVLHTYDLEPPSLQAIKDLFSGLMEQPEENNHPIIAPAHYNDPLLIYRIPEG
jgi:hypothetical protein